MIKSTVMTPLSSLFNRPKIPWWIKIKTNQPRCIYFFGPFADSKSARRSQDGYIEDLVQEKAFGITVEITQLQPDLLTVFDESNSPDSLALYATYQSCNLTS